MYLDKRLKLVAGQKYWLCALHVGDYVIVEETHKCEDETEREYDMFAYRISKVADVSKNVDLGYASFDKTTEEELLGYSYYKIFPFNLAKNKGLITKYDKERCEKAKLQDKKYLAQQTINSMDEFTLNYFLLAYAKEQYIEIHKKEYSQLPKPKDD